MKRILLFILSAVVFLLLFVMLLLAVGLISTGILAIPLALTVITGIFTQVASDLSPVPMILAGVSCLSAGLALALAVIVLFPKQVKLKI